MIKNTLFIIALLGILVITFYASDHAHARDGSGSFYERSTGTKHTFILENGGKNGYYFKQTKEDLERIRKNRNNNPFEELIKNQRQSKTTSPFEKSLNKARANKY